MKPATFAYHRAHDARGAVDRLAELGDEAKLLAGGQSLIAMMNFRLARPAALVDIGRVDELRYLRRENDTLRVGALTTHHTLERANGPELAGFRVLPSAARWIGHYPIRTRGTIGGSVAHGDSTAEWCLLAVLLDARIVAQSVRGLRTLSAREFFRGFFTTALEPDELIVEIVFPRPCPHAALTEFAQRKGDFAIVAAAVNLERDGERCTGATVALGGVDSVPVRIPEAERLLAGTAPFGEGPAGLFAEVADVAAAAVEPGGDAHGSADYRRRLVRTLLVRALTEAVSGAAG